MADTLSLADIWIWFARECDGYSPIYTRIARAVAADAELLTMVQQAPPRAHQPNVLLAAVHALLLGGLDHPLGAVYAGASDADPAPLFLALCREQWPEVLDLMTRHHTNTNEVGRSAVIGPALTAAAATTGAPIALIDVGCSAGLNLVCDRYLLDYGAAGVIAVPPGPYRVTMCQRRSSRDPREIEIGIWATPTRTLETSSRILVADDLLSVDGALLETADEIQI